MYKSIKPILFLINTIIFTNCFAQVIYDPNAAKKYDNIYKKLPSRIQKELRKSDKSTYFNQGLAILTEDKTDTINKNELGQRKLSTLILTDINPKTGKEIKSKPQKVNNDKEYLFIYCGGGLFADTLVIQIGELFFGNTIMHYILKSNVSTFYAVYIKYDTVFKNNSTDSLTNLLSIPTETVKFYLSDTTFKIGETIYGNAEIITNTYFEKDTWEENWFYKLRRRMKYYFRFQVKKG
jgi:hypothetical protein